MKLSGYSLTLMPKGELYEKYKALIEKIADKNGSLPFEPHVTLLGNSSYDLSSMQEKSEELAKKLKPYTVELIGFGMQDYFYRQLYLKAKPTPEVMNAYDETIRIFDVKNPDPYMPHLSLLYGNFSEELKEGIIESLDKNSLLNSFEVDSFFLIDNHGESNEWKVLQEYKFIG